MLSLIKERIIETLDPEELIERLGKSTEELVELFEDDINEQLEDFYDLDPELANGVQ